MGQVTVAVNGRSYRLRCGDGEETRLRELADYVAMRVDDLAMEFGQYGDDRLLLMVTLMVTEEMQELAARVARLEAADASEPAATASHDEVEPAASVPDAAGVASAEDAPAVDGWGAPVDWQPEEDIDPAAASDGMGVSEAAAAHSGENEGTPPAHARDSALERTVEPAASAVTPPSDASVSQPQAEVETGHETSLLEPAGSVEGHNATTEPAPAEETPQATEMPQPKPRPPGLRGSLESRLAEARGGQRQRRIKPQPDLG